MWLMILLGAALNIKRKHATKEESVICCSMLCISAFLMIFEPDPRYIMLYTPLLLLLSVSGWREFTKFILVNIPIK